MKIALVYSGAKHGGGVDTYLDNLFKADKNHTLTLFTLGNWMVTEKLETSGEKVRAFSAARFNPMTVFKMAKELRNGKYDLVVTGGVVSNAYGRAAALFAGIPVVTVVHSEQKLDYANPITRFIYLVIDRLTRWKTNHYITVSEYLKHQLEKSGISSKKITVIYNGVSFVGNQRRKNPGLVIGSVGRLDKVKNFEALIRACMQLKEENWKLQIAGEGPSRSKLEKIINVYGLAERVELLGRVNDVGSFLAELDLYVQPSICEGFCLTVVEAMRTGLPVIVTPGGALPELVENGKAGLLLRGFKPEEIAAGIERLLADKVLREELAKKGRLSSERYNLKKWGEETFRVFGEAVK